MFMSGFNLTGLLTDTKAEGKRHPKHLTCIQLRKILKTTKLPLALACKELPKCYVQYNFHFFVFQLLGVQLYQPHWMELDKDAQEQQKRTTIQFVSFPAMLALMQSVHHPENVSKTEPGVGRISFAKVI